MFDRRTSPMPMHYLTFNFRFISSTYPHRLLRPSWLYPLFSLFHQLTEGINIHALHLFIPGALKRRELRSTTSGLPQDQYISICAVFNKEKSHPWLPRHGSSLITVRRLHYHPRKVCGANCYLYITDCFEKSPSTSNQSQAPDRGNL